MNKQFSLGSLKEGRMVILIGVLLTLEERGELEWMGDNNKI